MRYAQFIKPMSAKIAEKSFNGDGWLFELKLDGYRAIAELDTAAVKFYSRNGLSFSEDYPEIFTCLKKLNLRAVLDGEVVALDAKNRPSFQLLQQAGIDRSIRPHYYVFDLLELDGKNIRHQPLLQRKKLLLDVVSKFDCIRYADHIESRGKDFFKLIVKKDIEGMMAKRADSQYYDGKKSADWLKIKNHHEQEAVIIGYTEPGGSRKFFGAVLLGVYKGRELTYVGHAGTGFSERLLEDVYGKMKPLAIDQSPVKQKVTRYGRVTWLRPALVGNIKFSEWTQDGHMRHPVFLGLRKDKSPQEVVRE